MEILAEVDFFKESPYIQLLQGYSSVDELRERLHSDGLSKPAIHNVIQNLESLGVIQNRSIVDVEAGFPEREFGKYRVTYYENDLANPFQFFIKNIERIAAKSDNMADLIEPIDAMLLAQMTDFRNTIFETNEDFQILSVVGGNCRKGSKVHNESMSLNFSENQWVCMLGGKHFELSDGPYLNALFKGNWVNAEELCEVNYDEVQVEHHTVENFLRTYAEVNHVEHWGKLGMSFQDVPVAPSKGSHVKWFMHLLKKDLQSKSQFYTEDELEQRWNNLLYTFPQLIRYGKLDYSYKQILQEFPRDSEMYWLLQAASDLNPFKSFEKPNKPRSSKNIIFQESSNASIVEVLNPLQLGEAASLIIIDRYINTKRHFEVLALLQSSFDNLDISITTMKEFRQDKLDRTFITETLNQGNIQRTIKDKRDIPHDRYWKIDDVIFNVSKSLDFMKMNRDKTCDIGHTIFTQLGEDEVEPQAKALLGGQDD